MSKSAIVTGAASGIGKGIASALVREGLDLFLVDRDAESLDATTSELQVAQPAGRKTSLAVDVSTDAGRSALFEAAPFADVLVNNVGYYENIDFFALSDEQWLRMIDLNFMVGMKLARFYLRKMLADRRGRVIFISSESAINPDTEKVHYCVAKTMILGLSRNLAELTVGTDVTVNTVLPGPTLTEGTRAFITQRYAPDLATAEKAFMASRPTSLIRRLVRPEEIGGAVAFLAKDDSGAINGSCLRVEGGIIRTVF